MKQDVIDGAWTARVIYFVVAGFHFTVFLTYESQFKDAFKNLDISYLAGFFGNMALSLYFLYTVGANPGYAGITPLKKLSEETTVPQATIEAASDAIAYNVVSGQEELPGAAIEIVAATPVTAVEEVSPDGKVADEKVTDVVDLENPVATEPIQETKAENKQEELIRPAKNFCKKCKVVAPYRSRHCDRCERCVLKFDHHCFWIGGCVGELNHRNFLIFTFFQSTLHIWLFNISMDGLGRYKYYDYDNDAYGQEFGAFFVCFIISLILCGMTCLLFGYHCTLVVLNETSWEQNSRGAITYFKGYPRKFSPFSYGIRKNIELVVCHPTDTGIDWDMPTFEEAATRKYGLLDIEWWTQ